MTDEDGDSCDSKSPCSDKRHRHVQGDGWTDETSADLRNVHRYRDDKTNYETLDETDRRHHRKGHKAWAGDDEDYDEYTQAKSRSISSRPPKKGSRGKIAEYNKLNSSLFEDEEGDQVGSLRHQSYGAYDEEDDWGEADKKASRRHSKRNKKRSELRPSSEGVDWMSPRKHTDKGRPQTDNAWLNRTNPGADRSKRVKNEQPGRKWAKAPTGTAVTTVSMLHPKVPKSNKNLLANKSSTIVKTYEVGSGLCTALMNCMQNT